MFRINHRKAQAATELAVFGAILIFILGTIIRSAAGNSYNQNQNFKAMRMAMLASWNGSKSAQGPGAVANTSRNTASILFVEDRLSPDFNKYGDLDRNPYIANGSGSFTYEMLYPLDVGEAASNLPIMDVYINNQYFPFTTASYVTNRQLTPSDTNGCSAAQNARYQREWVTDPVNPAKKYKLFYTMAANGTNQFLTSAPPCALASLNTVACKDLALSSSLVLPDKNGTPFPNGGTNPYNGLPTQGDMMYDLLRNGNYYSPTDPTAVETQFPPGGDMRTFMAWQWTATLGSVQGNTTDGADPMIGLDPDNNQYPSYDIDGRLKEVTIYSISQDPTTGYPMVSYEDFQGGDIDSTWDSNSCGPKPGLQNNSQIYTFTQDGTYLQIKEGKMYNPETGQEVRSVNKRNNIDIVQRSIQLSNNTGRFCTSGTTTPPGTVQNCSTPTSCTPGTIPNPVEVCADGKNTTCFLGDNLKATCYDTSTNTIWVRSRIEDRRGNFWMTNASGQLKVQ